VLALILLAVRTRFDRTNPVAFYFAGWVIATACLVAWVRGGTGFWIASRYSMYSMLLLIFCYTFLAQYLSRRSPGFDRRRFYAISIAVAFGVWLIANINAYKKLSARRQMVLTGIEFYRAAPETHSPMIDPEVEKDIPSEKMLEQVILTRAIQEGVYALPPKQEIRIHP
jgi:hypothetical protein